MRMYEGIDYQKFAKKLLAKYWGSYTGLGDTFLENLQGLTTLKIYQADERYAKRMDEEAEKFISEEKGVADVSSAIAGAKVNHPP